ncbi:MAG: cupin domain-containing protein, partial [Candidatus Bathyarchaeota archaeon]|nr:cupin domain-containing protein [Candidatus Bathyarchaeota archaeon]
MSSSNEFFSARLGGATGICPYKVRVERRLSDVAEHFLESGLAEKMLRKGENPLIYEVFEISQESTEGKLNVCCTVLYPGKIGDEYFLTKGHFHEKESTSEVYVGMEGEGIILIQDRDGKSTQVEIGPNVLVYIPPNTAHRSVNTGNSNLVFLAIYPSEAGHDYEAVRTRGFKELVTENDGKPRVVENPRYPEE